MKASAGRPSRQLDWDVEPVREVVYARAVPSPVLRTRDLIELLDHVAPASARLHPSQLNRWVRAGVVRPSVADSGRGGQRRWSFADAVLLRCVGLEQDAGSISHARLTEMARAFEAARDAPLTGRLLIGDRMTGRWRIDDKPLDTRSAAVVVFDLGWISDELERALDDVLATTLAA